MTKHIDPQLVKSLFRYDPATGILTHRVARQGAKVSAEAGTVDKSGTKVSVRLYRRAMVDGSLAYVHRIIWVLMTGEQPKTIDHIDGDGLNNKWNNLRSVPFRVNGKNQKIHVTNTSGTSGVTYRKDSNRWRARIMVNGKSISLGTFDSKDDAITARGQAETTHNFGAIS